MVRVYNTLTRRKEILRPLRGKPLRMFVCGPTVYDLAHIGHGRTFLTFDLVARYLRFRGMKVRYVQNITDIDDKIIARAKKTGRPWQVIANEFTEAYLRDMEDLGIRSVDRYVRATSFLPAMLAQIRLLLRRKFAYITETGVYFHVPAFRDYGKLSHRKLADMREAIRIEPDPAKKHPADFALWKFARPNEPAWPSPWGEGRPGWHIEDTAMTSKLFGPQYDLHGGALDLIFPHHECEIAQNEAAYGKKPFVRYWMHAGFLTVRGEKMAKSLGNFVTIRELLETWPPEVFRLFVFNAHYRTPLDYSEDLLAQAASAFERLRQFAVRLDIQKSKDQNPKAKSNPKSKIQKILAETRRRFFAAMDNDFDTPKAIAAIFTLVRNVNPLLEEGLLTAGDAAALRVFLADINTILGILPKPSRTAPIPKSVEKLLAERERLRSEKRFAEADVVRKKIYALGWQVEDTVEGPRLRPLHTQSPT